LIGIYRRFGSTYLRGSSNPRRIILDLLDSWSWD